MNTVYFMLILFHLHISCAKILQCKDCDDDNGGISSEFKPKGYQWNMTDLKYTQDLIYKINSRYRRSLSDRLTRDSKLASFIDHFLQFLKALPEVLKRLETDLDHILKKNRMNGVITGRIKSLESLWNKMKQEKTSDYRDITDIVGCRVTVPTLSDISKFKNLYLRAFNKSVTEIRCYGVCGPTLESSDPRVKIYWPWRGSGYRRLHFKVAIPKLKTAAEIQVGTPYMTLWADWEHAVVYKGPKDLHENNDVKEYSQLLAEYYSMLDNIRDRNMPKCPEILRKTKAKEIFSDQELKKFGVPFNACHLWSDLSLNIVSLHATASDV